jgi:hypothetical protein
MRESERYAAQAEVVMRMAARAESEAERRVCVDIADGWRKLAAEAARNERQEAGPPLGREPRSFRRQDGG